MEMGNPVTSNLTWGLKPLWADKKFRENINARSETAADKPFFRDAMKKRRCLIFADGFYEPDKKNKIK